MPKITISGMPATPTTGDWSPERWAKIFLHPLITGMQYAVSGVDGLSISANEVSVFLPNDLVADGLGEELIAEVSGLFDLPERTSAIKKALIDAIAKELEVFARGHLPQCRKVECYIASTVAPADCSMIEIPRGG